MEFVRRWFNAGKTIETGFGLRWSHEILDPKAIIELYVFLLWDVPSDFRFQCLFERDQLLWPVGEHALIAEKEVAKLVAQHPHPSWGAMTPPPPGFHGVLLSDSFPGGLFQLINELPAIYARRAEVMRTKRPLGTTSAFPSNVQLALAHLSNSWETKDPVVGLRGSSIAGYTWKAKRATRTFSDSSDWDFFAYSPPLAKRVGTDGTRTEILDPEKGTIPDEVKPFMQKLLDSQPERRSSLIVYEDSKWGRENLNIGKTEVFYWTPGRDGQYLPGAFALPSCPPNEWNALLFRRKITMPQKMLRTMERGSRD